ncbi:DUF7373 family lipoprotein [Nocardia thailandica]
MRIKSAWVIGTAALVVAVSGCGSETDAAVPAPAAVVDPTTLDVGSFPTRPAAIEKSGLNRARLSEAQRLANHLPLPMDVDPRFYIQEFTGGAPTAFLDPTPAMGRAQGDFDEDAKGYVAGYYTSGRTDADVLIATRLSNTVLIFNDPAAATAAADALSRRDFERTPENKHVPIDGSPESRAYWRPTQQQLFAFTPVDRYVVFTNITDNAKIEVKVTDIGAMTPLVAKSITAIGKSLAGFQPTPADKLEDLQLDYDGMLAKTLPRPSGESGATPGIYKPTGALLWSNNPARDRDLFSQAGVDWVSTSATTLYRAADVRGAELIFKDRSTIAKRYGSADSPKNLPGARCMEYKAKSMFESRFKCVMSFDRYVFQSRADQLIDAHQQISAQYAMLVNAK